MATFHATSTPLQKVINNLRKVDLVALPVERKDEIIELISVLENLERVLAGELRIVASGAVTCMKSTVLGLLLGRPGFLKTGSGPTTAVPTHLRLVRPGSNVAQDRVRILTASGARVRARALLDLSSIDDGRELAELAEVEHRNRNFVVKMLDASTKFEAGKTYDLNDFEALGGVPKFGGYGSELIERVVRDVEVDWNLDWAGHHSVVLIDLPGTGKGRVLEEVAAQEQHSVANVVLSVVSCATGSQFRPPPAHQESACIFVATKIDCVERPREPGTIQILEDAVAASLRIWRDDGQRAEVAALSGVWACADEQEWERIYSESSTDAHREWRQAQESRDDWRAIEWDPEAATKGELQEAVVAALDGGGADRLRKLIVELVQSNRDKIDDIERDQLLARGRELVASALANVAAVKSSKRNYGDLVKKFERDAHPIDELRRISRVSADQAIYSLDVWDRLRPLLRRTDVGGVKTEAFLKEISLESAAQDAVEAVEPALKDSLSTWSRTYCVNVPPVLKYAAQNDAGSDLPYEDKTAESFSNLGRRLVKSLHVGGTAAGGGSRRLTIRAVARARAELAMLLERMLVARFAAMIAEVKDTVKEDLSVQEAAESINPTIGDLSVYLRRAEAQLSKVIGGESR